MLSTSVASAGIVDSRAPISHAATTSEGATTADSTSACQHFSNEHRRRE